MALIWLVFTDVTLWCLAFLLCMPTIVCSSFVSRNVPNQYSDDHRSSKASSSSHDGLIMPMLLFTILLSTVIGIGIHELITRRGAIRDEPEVQGNMILCHGDNSEYEYNLILRVGCPTANFDMKNGYIDFAALGEGDEVLGSSARFRCSLLPNQVCGEMHMIIERMTPMPPITGILANHGDHYGSIFFYEYVLVDLSNNKIIETRVFNTYLENKPTIYRGIVCTGELEDGFFPELPIMEWTNCELAIIVNFIVMTIGSLTMILEFYDLFPFNRKQDGSMYRSLFGVLCVVPPSTIIMATCTIIYKFYFKRNLIRNEYSIDQESGKTWRFMSKVYLVFLLAITLTLLAVFIYYGLVFSMIKSLYWWCSTLVSSVIVLGVWSLGNKLICVQSLFEESIAQAPPPTPGSYHSNYTMATAQASGTADPENTMFFTIIASSSKQRKTFKGSQPSGTAIVKLYNPNMKRKAPKQKVSNFKLKHTKKKKKRTKSSSKKESRTKKTSVSAKLSSSKKKKSKVKSRQKRK